MPETPHINTFLTNTINKKGFQIPLLYRCGSVQKQGMKLHFCSFLYTCSTLGEREGFVPPDNVYSFFGFTRKNRFFHCNGYIEGLNLSLLPTGSGFSC